MFSDVLWLSISVCGFVGLQYLFVCLFAHSYHEGIALGPYFLVDKLMRILEDAKSPVCHPPSIRPVVGHLTPKT